MYLSYLSIFFMMAISFMGCSSKISEMKEHKNISVTQCPTGKVPLLRYLNKTDKKLGKNSAFYSLNLPSDAFAARLFLIDNAKTSLNVQYYIYDEDTIGKVFLDHLFKAAQRGVKIRILLDDFKTTGKDKQLIKVALHPNVELRIFNPNKVRKLFRYITLAFNSSTLGKRMHNKSLIADGTAAIIGGRNIGDVYFSTQDGTLFLDYDILCIGNVVPKISKSFDTFWNSKEAVDASKVVDVIDIKNKNYKNKFITVLNQATKQFSKSCLGKGVINSDFMRKVKEHKLILTVVKNANFYYDSPNKVNTNKNDDSTHISTQLAKHLKKVKSTLLIISPYFVPNEKVITQLKYLRQQDVNITIVTNSLASTDVSLVYAGYKKFIKALLDIGVNLYELKPNSFKKLLQHKEIKKLPKISLHTKMILMDKGRLAVGSANMDPRSDKLNTELFLVIHSHKLTKQQENIVTKVLNLKNCYKLSWGKYPKEPEDDIITYGLRWHTLENGKEKIYYHVPKVGLFKALGVDLVSLLPIDGLL